MKKQNEVVLKDLCREYDIDPTPLRKLLRSEFGKKGSWRWVKGSKEEVAVRAFMSKTFGSTTSTSAEQSHGTPSVRHNART